MLRFLLFRFLPRRLMPLLMLYEVIQLIRRLRANDDERNVYEGRATSVGSTPTSTSTAVSTRRG